MLLMLHGKILSFLCIIYYVAVLQILDLLIFSCVKKSQKGLYKNTYEYIKYLYLYNIS